MTEYNAMKTQNKDHGRDNGRRIRQAAVGLVSCQLKGLRAALVVSLAAIIFVSPAQAQPSSPPKEKPDRVCKPGEALIDIPEVKSKDGKLRAVLMLSDEDRGMWDNKGRCEWQHLRYFKGWNAEEYWKARDAAKPPPPWPSNGQPIPGPTLRARVGDLIQISFLNQIDTTKFANSLDLAEKNVEGRSTLGCDKGRGRVLDPKTKETITVDTYPRNDREPNCLHGSSTVNVHFHGTHTTPSTTGDNVLLYIRPALKVKGQIEPTDADVKSNFSDFFSWCEENDGSPAQWDRDQKNDGSPAQWDRDQKNDGSPTPWEQLPVTWRKKQQDLLEEYDRTAPYQGIPGNLPHELKLWPQNEDAITKGLWPQYSIGAFPYCFRIPEYGKEYGKGKVKVKMGQAPGTHWYHAHKHGSTALNVGNGMTGAFIIEGLYDDQLRKFYSDKGNTLEEKVLVIQQLETSLNLLSGIFRATPFLSVNGQREPVIEMRRGQVQLWRIVNGAARSFVQFRNFVPPGVEWRQTAQDGVQFHLNNYKNVGKVNAPFNMAAANRVDLLVKAPQDVGSYKLQVWESVVANPRNGDTDRESTLLTVRVTDPAVTPSMEFIDEGEQSFPKFPPFLEDIPEKKVSYQRTLTFNTTPAPGRQPLTSSGRVLPLHTINDKLFDNMVIEQTMGLDTVEEWTVSNKTVGTLIAHPLHIHINPFQVVEVFDPNIAEAKTVGDSCYADPKDPKTWKPCNKLKLERPFVWWDVMAIPSARDEGFLTDPEVECKEKTPPDTTGKYECPDPRGNACGSKNGKQKCKIEIPGYFKMRSLFADFLGQFVLHCHILGHEDRGMMELIQIAPKRIDGSQKSGYTHR